MTNLENVPLTALEKELARRQERIQKKHAEREALLAKLAELDAEIAQLTGNKVGAPPESAPKAGKKQSAEEAPPAAPAPAAATEPGKAKKPKAAKKAAKKKPGKRGRKPVLPGAIFQVLADSDRPLNSQEIADELQRRNFPTKSKDLKSLVQEAVYRVPGIKRVKRGVYTAKKQAQ